MSDLPDVVGKGLIPVVAISAILIFSVRAVRYGSIKAAIFGVKEVVVSSTTSTTSSTTYPYSLPSGKENPTYYPSTTYKDEGKSIIENSTQEFLSDNEEKKLGISIIRRKWHWRDYKSVEFRKDLCFFKEYDFCIGKSNSIDLGVACKDGKSARLKRRIHDHDSDEVETESTDYVYNITINGEALYYNEEYYYAMDTLRTYKKRNMFHIIRKNYDPLVVTRDTMAMEPDVFIGCLLTLQRTHSLDESKSGSYYIDNITLCKKGPLVYPTFKLKQKGMELIIRSTQLELNIDIGRLPS